MEGTGPLTFLPVSEGQVGASPVQITQFSEMLLMIFSFMCMDSSMWI